MIQDERKGLTIPLERFLAVPTLIVIASLWQPMSAPPHSVEAKHSSTVDIARAIGEHICFGSAARAHSRASNARAQRRAGAIPAKWNAADRRVRWSAQLAGTNT